MAQPLILLVDDEAAIRFSVGRYLGARGFEVVTADGVAAGVAAFRARTPDAAVIDYELGDGDAIELLGAFRAIDPAVPVVVVTGHATIDRAVKAVKEGAENFLVKPPDLTALTLTLERVLQRRRLERREAARGRGRRALPDPFIGDSPAIRRLADLARRIAASDTPVLITGETGSGKGVLTRWLHAHGPRAEEALVELNCAGLNRDLLESELFGHERGAFTGAVAARAGLLEAAHRGTLFLDEIGDMDPAVQPKLLKAIEEGTFRRVGEVEPRAVDVRLVAATHRDLPALVRQGRFREDLLFRINAVPLEVPALRERPEDIPALAAWFLAERSACRGKALSPAALARLQAYRWPGNVRELRNVLERAAVLAAGDLLEAEDMRFDAAPGGAAADEDGLTLAEVERRQIERALRAEGGRVVAAARRLGIPRSTLYEKLKQHGLTSRPED
ncbi:MAG: sigma-54 dependent transcriptional regulator [Anaeromyxobacter sp.]